MNWFTSPLAATAIVCATLAGLAIPLRKLTVDRPVVMLAASNAVEHAHAHDFTVLLRLRLLADAKELTLKTPEGTVLWKAENLAAGEHENEVRLPLDDHRTELLVDVDFGDLPNDTALFLTLVPDGLDEQTQHTIGTGRIQEILDFHWATHH